MSKINWREKLKWGDEQLEDLRNVGFAYIRQGKYDIALPIFEALYVMDPNSAYDTQTLGALYLQLGNPNKAFVFFDKALKLDDADQEAILLNLSKAFFMTGKTHEGLTLAHILKDEKNPYIANMARALVLAYSE